MPTDDDLPDSFPESFRNRPSEAPHDPTPPRPPGTNPYLAGAATFAKGYATIIVKGVQGGFWSGLIVLSIFVGLPVLGVTAAANAMSIGGDSTTSNSAGRAATVTCADGSVVSYGSTGTHATRSQAQVECDDHTAAAAPRPTSRPATSAAATEQEIATLAFRMVVGDLPGFDVTALSDADVARFGRDICSTARSASSGPQLAAQIVGALDGTGMNVEQGSTLAGAALGAFCPDQSARLGLG